MAPINIEVENALKKGPEGLEPLGEHGVYLTIACRSKDILLILEICDVLLTCYLLTNFTLFCQVKIY